MKIKKGDNVVVTAGKDRGKTGKVVRALPKKEMVVVEGVNMKKKHQRASMKNPKGQIIDKTMPVHVSNVMLVDPKGGKRTRVGYQESADGKGKVRVAKKSGATLS